MATGMYKATIICDADTGILAPRNDCHLADELAHRVWRQWREAGSSTAGMENIDMDMVDDYIQTQGVDPYFLDFHDFLYEQKVQFGIVTQRMGRIVETILRREGLGRIPIFANTIEVEPFTIRLSFPHYNKLDCDACPSCTLFHVSQFRRPGIPLIFVGEKLVDLCSAAVADMVFARGDLLEGCRERGVDCEEIVNLRDVERIVTRMIMKDELGAIPRKESDEVRPQPPCAEQG